MTHGGRRPNAGRKAGSVTTRTREIADAIAADGELTPLEYLLSIVRDNEASIEDRKDAAKAAAPYMHPRLSQIEANVRGEMTYEERLKKLVGDD